MRVSLAKHATRWRHGPFPTPVWVGNVLNTGTEDGGREADDERGFWGFIFFVAQHAHTATGAASSSALDGWKAVDSSRLQSVVCLGSATTAVTRPCSTTDRLLDRTGETLKHSERQRSKTEWATRAHRSCLLVGATATGINTAAQRGVSQRFGTEARCLIQRPPNCCYPIGHQTRTNKTAPRPPVNESWMS